MKRKFTRVAAVLCGMSLLLTGCRIGNKNIVVSNILNDRQVFKIEGTVCSLKEARVYLTNYQNIYGTAYGATCQCCFGCQVIRRYATVDSDGQYIYV